MVRRRSHYDEEEEVQVPVFNSSSEKDEKTCRTCTDFKAHMRGANANGEKECPADRAEIGRSTWTLLHTLSVNLPENSPLDAPTQKSLGSFISSLSQLYPCEHCAEDFREDIKVNPPRFQTGRDFAQWLCEAHNRVNIKLDKPVFDCSRVYYRWRDAECD